MTTFMCQEQTAIFKLNVDWLQKLLSSELLLESRITTIAGILALFADRDVTVSKSYVIVIEVSPVILTKFNIVSFGI